MNPNLSSEERFADPDLCPLGRVGLQAAQAVLGLPFDAMRFQYATAVRAGWIERSMIASTRFERTLAALEQLSCGALARSV